MTTPGWPIRKILPDEKGPSCAGFLERAAGYFAAHGIARIQRLMTDNHFSYKNAAAMCETVAALGARHLFIKPHCPWQNEGRTLQPHPPDRMGLPAGLRHQRRTRRSPCALV